MSQTGLPDLGAEFLVHTGPAVPSPPTVASRRKAYHWSDDAKNVLIDALLDAVDNGMRTDTGWKPSLYPRVQSAFRTNGLDAPSKDAIVSKRDVLKKDLRDWEYILRATGTSRNPTGGIAASLEQWDQFITGRGTTIRKFQTSDLWREDDLRKIFNGTFATGQYSPSPGQLIPRPVERRRTVSSLSSVSDDWAAPDHAEESSGPRPSKRLRHTAFDGLAQLATAYQMRTEDNRQTSLKLAIRYLARDFRPSLTRAQFREAIKLLKDPTNAEVFIELPPALRTEFLMGELNIDVGDDDE